MNKAKQEIKNSEVSEIWWYGRGFYKCYIENLDVVKRIMRWSSVERCSFYYTRSMQIFAYDFVFPTRSYNRIAGLLGLPDRRKSLSKIKQGQRLQRLQIVDHIAQVKCSKLNSVED